MLKVLKASGKMLVDAGKVFVDAGWYETVDEDCLLDLKSGESYVAELDGKVVGAMYYLKAYTHNANYLEGIAVLKEHRRKGIAQELLKKYVEVSKKETPKKQAYAYSSTDANNKASIKMHKKFGFKVMGKIKKLHYGTDEIFFGYKLW